MSNDVQIAQEDNILEHVYSKKVFYVNPYKHFYTQYESSILDDIDEDSIEFDQFKYTEANVESVAKHIAGQLKEASKEKHQHVYDAMKYDPAFMLDPVVEYYDKFIPEAIKDNLTDDQYKEIISYYDPVTWAETNLLTKIKGGFKARISKKGIPYQAQLMRCKSRRIVVRAGRRIGKSLALVVRILHRAFTFAPDENHRTYKIVIFTPNQTQINVIFKMMEMLIDGNDKLISMLKDRKLPTRRTPITEIEMLNGVTIQGYVSGSTAIRGSAADMLVLDEGSFLTADDTDSVIALLNEHQDVELWVSSTPKGLKDWFYDRVNDKDFVSFHFPTDKYHPEWSMQMYNDFKNQLTDSGYKFEVLAEFSPSGIGVFQHPFISAALDNEYIYAEQKPNPHWYYSIGVDWNDTANGTQIVVVGYNPNHQEEGTKPYRLVERVSVSIERWTQTTAVREIIRLNRKWRAACIYTDYGYGAAANEMLHERGMKAQPNSIDKRLVKSQVINFSSAIIIRDPWTKKKVKKPVKPYMVNNAVRVFENGYIDIPNEDEKLNKQLSGYIIDRVTPNGIPVYAADPKHGDHILDALVLALLGFHMEFSTLVKPRTATNINTIEAEKVYPAKSVKQQLDEATASLLRDKQAELEEVIDANATSGIFMPNDGMQRRNLESRRFLRTKRIKHKLRRRSF